MENLFTKANMAKIERICSQVSNGRGFNYNDSQDLLSRTTMKLLESKSYDPKRALEPYVWMIASNVAKDMMRENARRQSMFRPLDRVNDDGERELDYAAELLCASESDEASFNVESADLWNSWKSYKERLDETDRKIQALRSYNVGGQEIADRLGCSTNSVSLRIYRLKKRINKDLIA
ncbi:MAG: sigma-70 family RNA polymerase sigma factor [Candidatus Cryptobacteroides sp.]